MPRPLGHLTNFCTNFFNIGKFVKIRDFSAEVTNSRSMSRITLTDADVHVRPQMTQQSHVVTRTVFTDGTHPHATIRTYNKRPAPCNIHTGLHHVTVHYHVPSQVHRLPQHSAGYTTYLLLEILRLFCLVG